MRKIIVLVATSADGYIARRGGGVDWLDRPRTAGDYGMGAFYRSIDTILWGRKTYQMTLAFEKQEAKGGGFDPKLKHCAFSHHPRQPRRPRSSSSPSHSKVCQAPAIKVGEEHLDDGRRGADRFVS